MLGFQPKIIVIAGGKLSAARSDLPELRKRLSTGMGPGTQRRFCGDACRTQWWTDYVCRGYHRNGKSHCSSRRIHEEALGKAVWNYAEELRKRYAAELKKVAQLQKQWALRKPSLDARCLIFRSFLRTPNILTIRRQRLRV